VAAARDTDSHGHLAIASRQVAHRRNVDATFEQPRAPQRTFVPGNRMR
jgi:hypothetical protein